MSKFLEPALDESKKNSLIDNLIFNTILIFGAVGIGVTSEILLAQVILEKVIKVTPDKSLFMAMGISVILFTCGELIKHPLKKFLQRKSKIPLLFKIGVITSCSLLFTMGGLSYYNIQKDQDRVQIINLNKKLESAREDLEDISEDDYRYETTKQKIADLDNQMKAKMNSLNSTPNYIKGSSFMALSLFSLVMLFCSSFLKALSMIHFKVLLMKYKRDRLRAKVRKVENQYEALQNRKKRVHDTSCNYIEHLSRKAVIEELLALMPVTSEYKEALVKSNNF